MAIYSRYPLKVLQEVEPFPAIQNTASPYLTEAAMYADQANQLQGYGYLVDGVGAFTYLGTVAGTAADYEAFSTATVVGSSVPVSKTGTNIVFTEDAFYNEQAFLTAGGLTLDLTGAVKGALSIVYCDRYIPTITGNYLLSGFIQANSLNELWFFWNGSFVDLMVTNKKYLIAPVNTSLQLADIQITILNFSTPNASQYEILFSTTNDILTASPVPAYNGTDLQYVHSGLTNGTVYYYWVKAKGIGSLDSDFFALSGTPAVVSFNKTGLVSFYNNNEASGTVSTDSHGTNNGTLSNITLGVPGVKNTAYRFNGTSSFVSYPGLNDKFNNTDFTIMFWFRYNAGTDLFRLFQNRDIGTLGTKTGFAVSINTTDSTYSSVIFEFNGSFITFVSITRGNVLDGLFHHLAFSFNKTTGKIELYEDGVLKGSVTSSPLINGNFTSQTVLAGKSNSNTQYFNGDMDIPVVFQRLLTALEITEHYNNGNGTEYVV